MAEEIKMENPELTMLTNNKESGYNYRQRRHSDWDENYELGRDKVTINRLTQRQSVNLPLMKLTMRTLLKDMDDMPVLQFENLDNDKEAEVFKNEFWKLTGEENKFEILDIVDKKQEFYFGRSFDQWQIIDGKVRMSVEDPMDILVSRYTDPSNIDSSRLLIHTHIFKPLTLIESNKDYDQEAIKRLKTFYATEAGLIKASQNEQMRIEKNKKMADMGVPDIDDPILGETYVELSLHFVYHKEKEDEEEQLYLYVECDDQEILMKKPLEEVIGVTKDHFWRNHFPYNSWAGDVERQDFWSDGVGDTVRTPNKVLNSWFSQEVERRTMSNFGMHYYDATVAADAGWTPSTFEPVPWGWYGLPGKPEEFMKKVEVAANDGNMESMQFIIGMIEKATGATPTQQGAQTDRQVTLGEVQLALGEAKERIKGMSKFYTQVWKDRGLKFTKLIEAAADKIDAVKVYKKGRNTDDIYSREIAPKDWMTPSGYRCRVWSQDEKNAENTDSLQKLNAVRANIPGNPKLDEIYQRKMLEFAGLSPDEIKEVMDIEQQKRDMMNIGAVPTPGMTGAPGGAMMTPQLSPPITAAA
jgi:hypothetical protein